MESARSILKLEQSASESELLDVLRALTVPKLKLLCKENATKTSGNKADIIGRLVTTWKAACDASPKTCGASAGSSFDLPAFNEIRSWTKDLSPLTHFTFMQLYHYLVNSKDKTFDKKSMEAFKSLKAYQYFSDGLVTNVWTHYLQQEDKNKVVVKGYCFASLKAKTTYTVHVVLKTDGEVKGGACTCVAGKGQACSHIAALLFFLEDLKQKGTTTIPAEHSKTVTDKLQQWHVPPKRDIAPKRLSDITFHKAAYGTAKKVKTQPREETTATDDNALAKLVTTVTSTLPKSGLAQFWNTCTSAPDETRHSLTQEQAEQEMQEGMLQLTRKLIIWDGVNTTLPQSAMELDEIDTGSEYMKELCSEFEQEQIIDATLSNFIEQATRGQSECNLWRLLHNGRLTSSSFGEILQRRDGTDPVSIQRRIMGYTPMKGLPAPLKWGREKEATARFAYVQRMHELGHKDLRCQSTGLTLLPSHSYMGTSSDGLIVNHRYHKDNGVLEIKCPFSVEKSEVHHLAPIEIAQRYPKQFFLELQGSKLRLKRSSHYYYQVKGEMAIKQCKWCHFVVWTEAKEGMFIEEIIFDEGLWNDTMRPRLQEFYCKVVVPEILTRRLQRTLF